MRQTAGVISATTRLVEDHHFVAVLVSPEHQLFNVSKEETTVCLCSMVDAS